MLSTTKLSVALRPDEGLLKPPKITPHPAFGHPLPMGEGKTRIQLEGTFLLPPGVGARQGG